MFVYHPVPLGWNSDSFTCPSRCHRACHLIVFPNCIVSFHFLPVLPGPEVPNICPSFPPTSCSPVLHMLVSLPGALFISSRQKPTSLICISSSNSMGHPTCRHKFLPTDWEEGKDFSSFGTMDPFSHACWPLLRIVFSMHKIKYMSKGEQFFWDTSIKIYEEINFDTRASLLMC